MNKLRSILMVLLCTFTFTACSTSTSSVTSSPTSEEETPVTTTSSEESELSETNNILVVYFSGSGSTRSVAETIAETFDADIFEITPVEPYTSEDLNWTNDNSRVSVEHNDESKRDVPLTQTTPDNWDTYDTVFVGYPIWWGIAAWPMNNFASGNDFTGKTVIPFCTSASSGIGQSAKNLEEMAGTGNWLEGQRFSSGTSISNIESWVNSLELN